MPEEFNPAAPTLYVDSQAWADYWAREYARTEAEARRIPDLIARFQAARAAAKAAR